MVTRISLIDERTGEPQRPCLPVELRGDGENWIPFKLLVDSGSDLCIIPIEWVTEYNLTMKLVETNIRSFRTSAGAIGYGARGNLELRIAGRPFFWPCLYSLPPNNSETEASELLERILRMRLILSSPTVPPAIGRGRPRTFSDWMKQQFPILERRPGILGRRGFLEDFELILTHEQMTIARRTWYRQCFRWMFDRAMWFLRLE